MRTMRESEILKLSKKARMIMKMMRERERKEFAEKGRGRMEL